MLGRAVPAHLPFSCKCCMPGTAGKPANWSICSRLLLIRSPSDACSLFSVLSDACTLLFSFLFVRLTGCAGADAGACDASPEAAAAAFAAGAGLLLSGGHDALLEEGRRWWPGLAAKHCVVRCAAVEGGFEMAAAEVARWDTRDSLVENMAFSSFVTQSCECQREGYWRREMRVRCDWCWVEMRL